MIKRSFVLVLATLLFAAGCSTPEPEPVPRPDGVQFSDLRSADAAELRDGGTLTLAAAGWPTSFNPWTSEGAATDTAADLLAPTLGSAVRPTEEGDWETDPGYAESVEIVADDPLTVEVRLNPDAVWQDGTPIGAADLAAFVEAVRNPATAAVAHPAYELVQEVRPGADDTSYQVVFSRPTADWPAAVYPPLPQSVSKDPQLFAGGFAETAVPANGPFVVDRIDRATGTVELSRNPRWWGEAPLLERIVWRVAEPEVLAEAYAADEVDGLLPDASAGADVDDADRRYAVDTSWAQLTLNGGRGPLSDAAVRQAVAAAVDRSAIADAMAEARGGATEAMGSTVLLPGQRGADVPAPERDVQQAAALLDGAGWAEGEDGVRARDGQQLELRFPVPEGDVEGADRADLVAEQLAEVGISVRVEDVPAEDFQESVVVPLAFDIVGFAWDASAFPIEEATARLTPADSNRNFTGIATEPVTRAFEAARGELNDERFIEAVNAADAAAAEQASIIALAPVPAVMVLDPAVRNLGPSTFAPVDWTIVGFEAED
ncbi:ABC transporter substrate-binding protein [uncultured Aeromicrobium sp.]|uniref:ABC transporter substrate-binding protein n=1 Tax=uncultured Aeromicrobium sp. TaxID=337820 RepID=UPI0025E19D8B|nr:ABC transporter substrate-binding protein [uncultured Aeromicrobium sp.]